jgi:predicted RNA-binding protein with RPS1 domain
MMSQQKKVSLSLKKATDELQKDNKAKAKPSQKKAADKMKSMSKKMSQSLEGSAKADGEDVKCCVKY